MVRGQLGPLCLPRHGNQSPVGPLAHLQPSRPLLYRARSIQAPSPRSRVRRIGRRVGLRGEFWEIFGHHEPVYHVAAVCWHGNQLGRLLRVGTGEEPGVERSVCAGEEQARWAECHRGLFVYWGLLGLCCCGGDEEVGEDTGPLMRVRGLGGRGGRMPGRDVDEAMHSAL